MRNSRNVTEGKLSMFFYSFVVRGLMLTVIMAVGLLSFSQSNVDSEKSDSFAPFSRLRINVGASMLNCSNAFDAKIFEVTGSNLPKSALSASFGIDFGLPKHFELGVLVGVGRADNRFSNSVNSVVMNTYEGALICRYDGILKKSKFRIEPFVGVGAGYSRLLIDNKINYNGIGDIWDNGKSINLVQGAVFSGYMGVDLGYMLSRRTMLSLQITYKQPFNNSNFKPDYRNSEVVGGLPQAGLFRVGISVGITWMLFGNK